MSKIKNIGNYEKFGPMPGKVMANPLIGLYRKKFLNKAGHTGDEQKYKNTHLIKSYGVFTEFMASTIFAKYLGEEFSPKIRLIKLEDTKYYMSSKFLKNFKSFYDLEDEGKDVGLEKRRSFIGINKIVLLSLLLGRTDLHFGNMGVVEKDGKQFAATVDLDRCFSCFNVGSFYELITRSGFHKEFFLNQEFLNDFDKFLKDLDFDEIKDLLEIQHKVLRDAGLSEFTVDEAMKALHKNHDFLVNMNKMIRIEMAIEKGDAEALKENLLKLSPNFKLSPPHAELQNYYFERKTKILRIDDDAKSPEPDFTNNISVVFNLQQSRENRYIPTYIIASYKELILLTAPREKRLELMKVYDEAYKTRNPGYKTSQEEIDIINNAAIKSSDTTYYKFKFINFLESIKDAIEAAKPNFASRNENDTHSKKLNAWEIAAIAAGILIPLVIIALFAIPPIGLGLLALVGSVAAVVGIAAATSVTVGLAVSVPLAAKGVYERQQEVEVQKSTNMANGLPTTGVVGPYTSSAADKALNI